MTNDSVGQPEQRQTHLIVPQDEAEQHIMAQIEKGEDLLNQAKSIQSKKQLRAARDEYTNWRKYTADLLKRKIFDTDELANEFAPQFDEYGWLFAPDTSTALQDDLDRDLLRLRSIYERLEFYPERAPQPTPTEDEAGKKRGPTARTQIRTEVFKRLKDEHPEMSHIPNWFLLRECGEKLTREGKSPFTRRQLIDCVHEKHPERKESALHPMIQGMTVNARGGAPGGIDKNVLYRVSRGQYVLYDPKEHGQITKGETIKPSVAYKNGEREKMDWDVFISHAWEDKESFARPLAEALEAKRLRVWFDEFTLHVGDRLRRSIDHGLANSRYGVVILSPHFFRKEWPQKELDGLVTREAAGEKVVLPVWHNISAEQIKGYSPTLADRVAVSSDRGLEHVVSELLRVIRPRLPLEPEMILIPAGEFLMGSDPQKDKYAKDNEQPQHGLYLPDYYIAKIPVTNAQYAAFLEATGHDQPRHWEGVRLPRGKEDHPVIWVTWHDAMAYCNWLAEKTGKPYRLPSEAEWEKAARGTDGRIFPWGNQWDRKRCNTLESRIDDTTPVGAYPEGASPYGLLDMVGNVWEWTSSLYEPYPYKPYDGREDPAADSPRVLRGGSWLPNRRLARCAVRYGLNPDFRSSDHGFRVAASPSSP